MSPKTLPAKVGLTLACLALLSAPAAAQQTMVGKWAVGGKCARPLSIVVIEPMGLSGEDFYCEFTSVRRKGNTVRWAGRCNFSENGYEPTKAVAKLDGAKLRYRFVGLGWNGPFVRCPAG